MYGVRQRRASSASLSADSRPRHTAAVLLSIGLLLTIAVVDAEATTSLPDNLLSISAVAAQLSALAYEDAVDYAVVTNADGSMPDTPYYYHADFDELMFFTQEPDQAIFARKDERCYLAFRGTTISLGDWQQNLNLATRTVYRSNNPDAESCRAREGFADFAFLDSSALATETLFDCIQACPYTEDGSCLILTGHSQGGATATVLSLWLVEYTPMVITFGAPMALMAGCTVVPRNDTYRFVNSFDDGDDDALRFDAVPFLPTPFLSSLTQYGHLLVLGPRSETVVYMGNEESTFSDWQRHLDVVAAHTMRVRNGTVPHSYEGRFRMPSSAVESLQLRMDGLLDGFPCAPVGVCKGSCGADHVCVDGGEDIVAVTIAPTQSPVAAIVEVAADAMDDESSTVTSGVGRTRNCVWFGARGTLTTIVALAAWVAQLL